MDELNPAARGPQRITPVSQQLKRIAMLTELEVVDVGRTALKYEHQLMLQR